MEQLIENKNRWMSSHVTDAEFPTPLSETGLALYQAYLTQLVTSPQSDIARTSTALLSIYPVDCHPLTIRYAIVLASKWPDDSDKEAIIEFLTQIMLEPNSPAQLFVGFFKGKPAACGMIYQDSHGALVTDVHALPLANQQELMDEMRGSLIQRCESNVPLFIEH
ncbi:hypothetical protein [Photobacterium nomapromontoriensis]|uniref:hypothetical protein n=1 Tax=Photobacterium nomapromontoriensis TaxID=2910237 RepID=UPI003D0CA13A